MAPTIAKFCYVNKQYFARRSGQTSEVPKKSINAVFAENLKRRMEAQGHSQAALAKKAGVVQRSMGNYLKPKERELGAKGKEPSAKLTEMAMVAEALGVEPWEMLIPQDNLQDVGVEKMAAELIALFRGMPATAQTALLEQARLVHKATRIEVPPGEMPSTKRA
jgi:transcriptional regulator with XRE-family HTH domain